MKISPSLSVTHYAKHRPNLLSLLLLFISPICQFYNSHCAPFKLALQTKSMIDAHKQLECFIVSLILFAAVFYRLVSFTRCITHCAMDIQMHCSPHTGILFLRSLSISLWEGNHSMASAVGGTSGCDDPRRVSPSVRVPAQLGPPTALGPP